MGFTISQCFICRARAREVFIFGAGGVARAITAQLVMKGVKVIHLTNRKRDRAVELARRLDCLKKTEIRVVEWEPKKWCNVIGKCCLIVNCTSLGMYKKGDLAQIVPWQAIRDDALIYETIYEPLETTFVQKAKQLGLKSYCGLNLFIHQAYDSLKIWTGKQPPIDVIRLAIEDYINKG